MADINFPQIPESYGELGTSLLLAAQGIYCLPVEPDTKRPAKFLGNDWQHKSSVDRDQLLAWFSATPFALAIHVGRSGLIAFDVDDYHMLPEILVSEFTENPGPWQSTREDDVDPLRGHRLYRMPDGRTLGNSLGEFRRLPNGEDWGQIRGVNGIIVTEPSRHSKAGGRYKWQTFGTIPHMRPAVADMLPDVSVDECGVRAATDAEITVFLDSCVGKQKPQFLDVVVKKFRDEVYDKDGRVRGSRHESAVRAVCWAMRDAAYGFYPARDAANALFKEFHAMLKGETKRFARGEFMGILAFAIAQVEKIDLEERAKLNDARLLAADEANGWAARTEAKNSGDLVLEDPYGGEPTIIPGKAATAEADSALPLGEAEEDEDADEDVDPTYFDSGFRTKDGKIRINLRDKPQALAFVLNQVGTGPLSGLFRRGSRIVHTCLVGEDGYIPPRQDGADDGPAQIHAVSAEGIVSLFDAYFDTGKVEISKTGKKNKQWRRSLFPKEFALRIMGAAETGRLRNLRSLRGVTHTPVIRPDGSVFDVPGYDDVTRLLYLPSDGLGGVHVPSEPTAAEIEHAKHTIMFPISEFPFVSDDDVANWLGCALTPLLRPIVPPPYQFGVIEAPSPGSGKGYLLGILRAVHGAAMRPGLPARDEEMSKVVMTMLAGTTAPIICFDNVRGVIHSAALEGVLTAGTISDRTLGKNTEFLEVRNDRLWMMTGNNAQIGGDLARRTLRITIDPGIPSPESRTNFRCQPVQWAEQNRALYLSALLTVIRGWICAGMPMPEVKRSDDYAQWVRTVRGISQFAGFPGTFANSEVRAERSTEDEEWARFLDAIVDSFGTGTTFTARELYRQITGNAVNPRPDGVPIPPDVLPSGLVEKFGSWSDSARFTKTMGAWLRNRVGRYAGRYKIVEEGKGTAGDRRHVLIYRIVDSVVPTAQDTIELPAMLAQ